MKTRVILINRDRSRTVAYAIGPVDTITSIVKTVDGRFYILIGHVRGDIQYVEVDFGECTIVFTYEELTTVRNEGLAT